MKHRLALITEIIAPYRIPVFNVLAARHDIDLHVIFLSESDPSLRQWHVYKKEIRFSYEVLAAWRRRVGSYNVLVNWGVRAALLRAKPEAVLCGGYNYLASWQAAAWARRRKIPLLLWSESTLNDLRGRTSLVEFLKRHFCARCDGFVAAGKSSRDYFTSLGAPDGWIFTAPDAVDVAFYASEAHKARQSSDQIRARYNLPLRYFLCAGRLVEEKGVFDLLSAYATLDENTRSQVGLVFAGEGVSREMLARRAAEIAPGRIRFCGFVHREQLPSLYALAEALVFPTHSDPWGLVVNEAMACGLPIIASDVAGCVPDLVQNAVNGFVVPAGNIPELARAMRAIVDNAEMKVQMGACSARRILAFTPEACAGGLAQATAFVCGKNR